MAGNSVENKDNIQDAPKKIPLSAVEKFDQGKFEEAGRARTEYLQAVKDKNEKRQQESVEKFVRVLSSAGILLTRDGEWDTVEQQEIQTEKNLKKDASEKEKAAAREAAKTTGDTAPKEEKKKLEEQPEASLNVLMFQVDKHSSALLMDGSDKQGNRFSLGLDRMIHEMYKGSYNTDEHYSDGIKRLSGHFMNAMVENMLHKDELHTISGIRGLDLPDDIKNAKKPMTTDILYEAINKKSGDAQTPQEKQFLTLLNQVPEMKGGGKSTSEAYGDLPQTKEAKKFMVDSKNFVDESVAKAAAEIGIIGDTRQKMKGFSNQVGLNPNAPIADATNNFLTNLTSPSKWMSLLTSTPGGLFGMILLGLSFTSWFKDSKIFQGIKYFMLGQIATKFATNGQSGVMDVLQAGAKNLSETWIQPYITSDSKNYDTKYTKSRKSIEELGGFNEAQGAIATFLCSVRIEDMLHNVAEVKRSDGKNDVDFQYATLLNDGQRKLKGDVEKSINVDNVYRGLLKKIYEHPESKFQMQAMNPGVDFAKLEQQFTVEYITLNYYLKKKYTPERKNTVFGSEIALVEVLDWEMRDKNDPEKKKWEEKLVDNSMDTSKKYPEVSKKKE